LQTKLEENLKRFQVKENEATSDTGSTPPTREEGESISDYSKDALSSLDGLEIIKAPRHEFKNIGEARTWAKENITGTYHHVNTGENIWCFTDSY
jgi:hypothetical protein